MTQIQDVRYTLIGQNDLTVLPDDLVNLALSDASLLQSSTDSTALRLYAAFLIAERWGSLGRVVSADGTSTEYVSADKLLMMYNKRINMINQSNTSNTGGFVKISTNKELSYNTDKVIGARQPGDL
jgi:hypothetical protein